jgi:hypothetical protein
MKSVSLLCHLSFALSCLTTAVNGNLVEIRNGFRARIEKVQKAHGVSRGVIRSQGGQTILFANPAAEKFFVDGTKIPDGTSS